MRFRPYSKMPASDEAREQPGPGGTWVALEKLHGAQLVVAVQGGQVRFGKRKASGDQAMRSLPNLEDPSHLISSPKDRPPPAGFGPIAPSWEPRRSLAGTYDEAWQARRAPFLPKDFQARFFNAAHPDLVCKRYLRGGEPVQIINASASPMRFHLPACALDVAVTIDGASARPPMNLQTVVLEPGGYHVMLLDISRPLKVGEQVAIVLVIEQAGKRVEVPVQAQVRPVLEEADPDAHHK